MPGPSPYLVATAYAGIGDRERVLPYLEQAVAQRDPPATDVGVDPVLDAFRADPRMAHLLTRAGLR